MEGLTELNRLLFQAARDGDAAGIEKWIAAGADPNAIEGGNAQHGRAATNYSLLMVASASPRSDAATVRALIRGGADISLRSGSGSTAIWYAVGGVTEGLITDASQLDEDHPYYFWSGGDASRLRVLLASGADAAETSENGTSLAAVAAGTGDPERLKVLLEFGVSVWPNDTSSRHRPYRINGPWAIPLFTAAARGSVECVRLILEVGFPADFACGSQTALQEARTVEVAELLWDSGARLSPGRWKDEIDEAFEDERFDVAEFLLAKFIAGGDQLRDYLGKKLDNVSGVYMNPNAVRMLLNLGADPNYRSVNLGTPLHSACWQGDGNGGRPTEVVHETLELLIAAGSDVNSRCADGLTPLHQAVDGDWESATSTKTLLEHGAEADAIGPFGMTPLMAAAERGALECVRLLLGAGANPDRVDSSGMSAKDYARDHLEVATGWLREKHVRVDCKATFEDAQEVVRLMNA